MTPADYLASLTGLRLAAHVMRAAKRGVSSLQHAADVLAEQARQDAVNEILNSKPLMFAAIRRHARQNGRVFA
jgi:hypothetical protein